MAHAAHVASHNAQTGSPEGSAVPPTETQATAKPLTEPLVREFFVLHTGMTIGLLTVVVTLFVLWWLHTLRDRERSRLRRRPAPVVKDAWAEAGRRASPQSPTEIATRFLEQPADIETLTRRPSRRHPGSGRAATPSSERSEASSRPMGDSADPPGDGADPNDETAGPETGQPGTDPDAPPSKGPRGRGPGKP